MTDMVDKIRDKFYFVRQSRDLWNRDLTFLVLILMLLFSGFLVLFPISSVVGLRIHEDYNFYIKKQFGALLVGLIAFAFAASISFTWLYRHATWILLFTLGTLLLVFAPGIGKSVQTSQGDFNRWLNLGFISVQPSEFSKITLTNYVCAVIVKWVRSTQNGGTLSPSVSSVSSVSNLQSGIQISRIVGPLLLVGCLLVLILLEPQYGTMFCMLFTVLVIFYVSGLSLWRMASLGLVFTPILVLLAVFSSYRFQRIAVWLDPYQYRYEGGYQLVTAILSYKNSTFFGNELSTGFAHRYLTFGHTDFVLPLFVENFGLLGLSLLFFFYAFFIRKVYQMLIRVHDPFVYLFCSGIFCMFMIQTLVNMMMATGLLPTTGISLPFFSFGGSNLLTSLIMMGLLFNMSRFSDAEDVATKE